MSSNHSHHCRPLVSESFIGRKTELDELKRILNENGSAAIAQYAGVGKTELMASLAEHAERKGGAPGGVFWVKADGSSANVVEALAGLVDKFRTTTIEHQEWRDVKVVVT